MDVAIKSTPETMEHRLIRTKQQRSSHHHQHQHRHHSDHHKSIYNNLIPEFSHVPRPDITLTCQPCHLPKFLFSTCLRVSTPGRLPYCYDRSAAWRIEEHNLCTNKDGMLAIMYGYPELAHDCAKSSRSTLTSTVHPGGILGTLPPLGWSNIIVPGKMSSIILYPILFIENKFNDVLDHCAFHTTGFRWNDATVAQGRARPRFSKWSSRFSAYILCRTVYLDAILNLFFTDAYYTGANSWITFPHYPSFCTPWPV